MKRGIERHFLRWEMPVMGRAAAWLGERWHRDGLLDLSTVLVTVPGARAGRQLTAALVDEAAKRGTPLLLPSVVTPDGLLGALLGAPAEEGTEIERWWAWLGALRGLDERARRVIAARGARPGDLVGGLRLAREVDRAHRALAGDGVRFAEVARRMSGTSDGERWAALAELEQRYLRGLQHADLSDGAIERIDRLERKRARAEGDVVLLGIAELSTVARRAIAAVAERTRVDALVLAPEAHANRFDDVGCVIPELWMGADLEREVGLGRVHFRVVRGPVDQADAALEVIEGWADLACEDVIIGNMDAEVASHLVSRGEMCGVGIRRANGQELVRTRAFRLLTAMLEYQEAFSLRGLGSLVRHEDVLTWLARKLEEPEASWLPALDEFALQSLAASTRDLDHAPEIVRRLIQAIEALLGTMAVAKREQTHTVSAWCDDISRVIDLLDVGDGGSEERGGYSRVLGVVQDLMSARNEDAWAQCTAHDALRLVRTLVQDEREPEPIRAGAIEMLGWLELVCDDSAGVVLTGFNEGLVPSRGGGSLVSDEVRRRLSLPTADAHAARDTYLLAALAGSGRRLAIVCARVTGQGDPLLPSRLMFACSKGEMLRRVSMWREEASSPQRRPRDSVAPASDPGAFRILAPDPAPIEIRAEAIERYSVTSFRDYLASPYLYYVRHVLHLSEVEEPTNELDASGFGVLIHESLAAFGRGPAATSAREREIEECLNAEIDQVIASRFGARMPVGVRIQREHARGRLRAFARWHAGHVKEGWTIRHVEWSPERGLDSADRVQDEGVAFDVDGKSVRLAGRIDRIDQHADGRWLLLDYKSSAKRSTPQQMHVKGSRGAERWVDLQLPLYRRLAERVSGLEASLGYVCVPAKANETGLSLAGWSAAQLANAEDCARDVIRRVRRGEFFELGSRPADTGVAGWLSGTGLIAGEQDEGNVEAEE